MTKKTLLSELRFTPPIPLVEASPRTLSANESDLLRRTILKDISDPVFDRFVDTLEWELGIYAFDKQQHKKKLTPSQARKACRDIAKAVRKLQTMWLKAPDDALRLIDRAYLDRWWREDHTPEERRQACDGSYSGGLSPASKSYFEKFERALGPVISMSEIAGKTPTKRVKGGRPRDPNTLFLVRAIAHAFQSILEITPTPTKTGPFAETVHWALDLVSEGGKVTSVPKYIERAVKEIKKKQDS